jgi:hypothetical protein
MEPVAERFKPIGEKTVYKTAEGLSALLNALGIQTTNRKQKISLVAKATAFGFAVGWLTRYIRHTSSS